MFGACADEKVFERENACHYFSPLFPLPGFLYPESFTDTRTLKFQRLRMKKNLDIPMEFEKTVFACLIGIAVWGIMHG